MVKAVENLPSTLLIIAHRGASAYAPENTIAAFEAAAKMKADMIELDIQLTADGRWVVMHDLSLKRTCGLRKKVRSVPMDRIKTLDAGSWFSPGFSGEKVPAVEEVLDWSKNKISLNLEVKGKIKKGSDALSSLLKEISNHGLKRHVILSSFDWMILKEIRKLDKNMAIGLLVSRQRRARYLKKALDLKAFSIHLPKNKMKKDLAGEIHKLNMRVFLYTLNTPQEMKRFSGMGIDGIFSNYPDLGRRSRD